MSSLVGRIRPGRIRGSRAKLPPATALTRYARYLLRCLGISQLPVRVVYQPRLRTTLGRADGATQTVELNPHLLARYPGELLDTLLHELCHLLAGVRHGHGPGWCRWMEQMGLEPRPCHSLEVGALGLRRRRWRWRCKGCGVEFERAHRAVRYYRCARCGAQLRVVAPVT